MPFAIHATEAGMLLELSGGVTVRHAQELSKCVAGRLVSGMNVRVDTRNLEDIDTSILQMLVSLRRMAGTFVVQEASAAFVAAVDRCALRRALLSKDLL